MAHIGNAHESASVPTEEEQIAYSKLPAEVGITDLGTQYKFMGLIEAGMEKYLQALQINPNYAPAYYNMGVMYQFNLNNLVFRFDNSRFSEANHFEDALLYYSKAIEVNKMYVEAYCNMGVIYKNTGRLEEAVAYYEKALALNPNFTVARTNMTIALTDLGTKMKAEGNVKLGIQYYKKALLYNSQYPDAYYNLGVAYGECHKYDRAVWYYELAILFNPYCCEAYNNLGVIYRDQDNLEKAILCYQSAIAINPKFSQSLNNLGVVYTVQGKLDEAFACVRGAIEEDPMYGEAYNNLGVLYRDEGLLDEAIKCYEKCLAINILSRNAGQNRLLAMNYLTNLSVADIFKAHKEWGDLFVQQFAQYTEYHNSLEINRPIRIGYMSPDFFVHSVSYFIETILSNHNRKDFYIICYSNVVKEDAKTQRLKQLPNEWKSITALNTQQVAELIHSDQIDILVELAGHTSGNRLDVTAMKPAPIQITYIGYPNTCGLSTIDYRITDSVVDPTDTRQQFVEELIRLPHGFLCYTPSPDAGNQKKLIDKVEVAPPPVLTNGFITFGSFNNLAKINDQVVDLWSAVLLAVPNSRMVVKCKPFAGETVKHKFLAKFEDRGIDASRLTLVGLLALNHDHMQSYSLMDISLDTFPYPIKYAGTTTTCEALWMGVPVITLVGESHAQNVGATLLTRIGYKPWICTTRQMYIDAAVALASNHSALAKIRSGLRERMAQSPLCDGPVFTQVLEQTYREKWKLYVDKRKASGKTTTTTTPTNGLRQEYLPIGTMTVDGKITTSGETNAVHAGADGPTSKSITIRAPTPTEYGACPPPLNDSTNFGGRD